MTPAARVQTAIELLDQILGGGPRRRLSRVGRGVAALLARKIVWQSDLLYSMRCAVRGRLRRRAGQ